MKKFLDYDAETKTTHYLHTDEEGAVIESIQDASGIIEYNASMAERLDKKADWWLVGSIPLTLCQEWATQSGTKVFTKEWQAYAKQQVQKREYRKLNPNNLKL